MTRNSRIAFVLALAGAVGLGCGAEAQQAAPKAGAKCVLAAGEASMMTQDLAEFMAKAALKNSISGMGAKPSGDVKLKCNASGLLQYCKAEQKACK